MLRNAQLEIVELLADHCVHQVVTGKVVRVEINLFILGRPYFRPNARRAYSDYLNPLALGRGLVDFVLVSAR